MRPRIHSLPIALLLIFVSGAQAQFYALPGSDRGVKLNSFVQADVNGDGRPDVVGIRNAPAGLEITTLLGNGANGFGAPLNSPFTGIDNAVYYGLFLLADFNGDGRPDIAVFGTDSITGLQAVGVLFGNGDGTFQAVQETFIRDIGNPILPPAIRCAVSVGDFNGDGKVDIAYLGVDVPFFGPNFVNVLPGNGDGTFAAAVRTPLPAPPNTFYRCLEPGDFNNDNRLDLALTNNHQAFMLLGNGDGTFQPPVSVLTGVSSVVAADVNGDGILDLVGAQFDSTDNITVALGDGTGKFPTVHSYAGPGQETFELMAVSDLNGDGHPDIAYLADLAQITPNKTTAGKIMAVNTLMNNGDGSFTVGKRSYSAGGHNPAGLMAARLGGSNRVDLAFSNADGGISVLLSKGDGTFQGNFIAAPVSGSDVQVGDFNGDGKPDLALADVVEQNGFPSGILLGNGDGTFALNPTSSCGFSGNFALADYNRDGKLDLASPGGVCLGNGDGAFLSEEGLDGVEHKLVLTADFNNDGKLDLAASDLGGFSILLGNGDGTFQDGIARGVDAPAFSTLAVADFNNDGKQDVAVLTSPGIALFEGKGDGTVSGPIVTPGLKSGPVTVADLNKDGNADLVVVGAGTFSVSLGNGDGTFQAPVLYTVKGGPVGHALIGDFNLDGRLDIAIGTVNEGVAVFWGDGTGKFSATATPFRVGAPINALASGDFNGDKKPDLAVVLRDGVVVMLLHQ